MYYNQNWDSNLSTVFWEDFELVNTFGEFGPDILVPVVGETLGVTCGNIMARSYEILSELQPEGYLVLGDTNSCLSAISAKRLHIPLFHMEAGNRCKDECLPEETNRRIVDVISDVNLCYSEFARKYLADTGLPKERTYQTGSPMAEVLRMNLDKIKKSDVLDRMGLEKISISCSLLIVRRTLIQRKLSQPVYSNQCSGRKIRYADSVFLPS